MPPLVKAHATGSSPGIIFITHPVKYQSYRVRQYNSAFIFACIPGFTQASVMPVGKPVLDALVLGKFPLISSAKIINDGRYISYLVNG